MRKILRISYILTALFILPSSLLSEQTKTNLLRNMFSGARQTEPQQPSHAQVKINILREFQLAQSFEKMGEYRKALDIYRMLYQLEPKNPNYSAGLERNMLNLKMFDELVTHYNEILKKNSSNISVLGKLGEVYYQWGKPVVADSIWNSIIEINPEMAINYSFLANTLIRNRLYDRAVGIFIEGRKRLKNNSLFERDLANLYFWKKDYIKGVEEYLKILQRNIKNYSLVESQILGIPLDEDVKIDEIANLIKREIEKDNKNPYYRKLLANLYFTNRKYSSAFQEYIDLDKILNANGKEILLFAEHVFNEKAYEYSTDGYQYVKANFPDIPEIMLASFGLAESYEKAGSPLEDEGKNDYIFSKYKSNYQTKSNYLSKAINEYEDIIKKYPNTIWAMKSNLRIGEIKLNLTFDLDGAVEYFSNVVKSSKDTLIIEEAMLKIGDCMIAKGDLKQAEYKYDEIISIGGNKADELFYQALYKKAFVNYLQGEFAQAEDISRNIMMKQSPQSRIYNDVLDLLIFIEKNKRSDEGAPREYARAQALIQQRKYSEAISLLEEIRRIYIYHQISDDTLYMIGKLKGIIGDYVGAVEAFRELIKDYPTSPRADEAQLRIGELYEICIGNSALAEKEYETLLVNFPNSIYIDETRKRIRKLSLKR